MSLRQFLCVAGLFLAVGSSVNAADETPAASGKPDAWPALTQTAKPWAYWWWMGSAVDTTNLTRELTRYRDAGMGGVHIIPIYGAKGWEDKFIPYLSPKWMEMLAFTVAEANRLGLGVDMTTGTGWCFGGPRVTADEANASVVWKTYQLGVGERIKERLDRKSVQALVAFGPGGRPIDLTDSISTNGEVFFSPPGNWIGTNAMPPKTWTVYAVSQKPSGQKVKRPSVGGEGHMLNLASPAAMTNYLRWFDEAFAHYPGPKPRAQYHDSYEYRTDWAPDFFAQFEQRRGYRLQDELPALFGKGDPDRIARVKCDYRETISDIMAEETLPLWSKWSHDHGFITRNEAHGSPGNWLDLYAAADIPETEMFHLDRNKLISKFASSAAHTQGKPLVASETGTWLEEHFTETLADMKYLLDDLFLSGVNHVFYHGTCYSPDEAGWPGWLFYASYEMNPRNPIWRDVPALNAYAARCQSVLQSGKPDNDILLYWPLHDFWHNTNGLVRNMSVHARDWFEDQPIGATAQKLWQDGYAFDYVSDRQLTSAKCADGAIEMPGGNYRLVVVPESRVIPLETFQRLLALAEAGATIVFEKRMPSDVSGWADLEKSRAAFQQALSKIKFSTTTAFGLEIAKVGKGSVLCGEIGEPWASTAKVTREPMTQAGLSFIRRSFDGGALYFIANRRTNDFAGWVPLGRNAKSVVAMDALSGRIGLAASRQSATNATEVHLRLAAGESILLRAFAHQEAQGPGWNDWQANGQPTAVTGPWNVTFLQGGPTLPADAPTAKLASWTTFTDTNAQRFAGTARYSTTFDAPASAGPSYFLALGDVRQSARVKLNGKDYGTLITPPFRVIVDNLKPAGNLLEVEVTSVAANRIRDLDRRGVKWKTFHDINLVNLDYQPFDASNWPLTDSGLLGPVTLTPVVAAKPAAAAALRDDWIDPDTGHRVLRLSRLPGASESFYFHQNAFTPDGTKMVFVNTAPGATNRLFLFDLVTRQSEPLTPLGASPIVVGRKSPRLFWQSGAALRATDLLTRETRELAELPPKWRVSSINADETLAAGTFVESGPKIDTSGPKSSWFNQIYEAKRPQALFTVDLATGHTNLFHHYPGWLGHVQFSPTDPTLLMFCHEGPWDKVDRIWHIRTDGSGLRLMHQRSIPGEIAGHEFWSPDGRTVWFDLQVPRGETFFLAGVDVATGQTTRYPIQRDQWSVHFNIARDQRRFAGDGGAPNMVAHATDGQWLQLFTPQPDGTLRAERLVNMAKHDYLLEPNVNFTPDGQWIVFRGNFEGSAQVYAVEVGKP